MTMAKTLDRSKPFGEVWGESNGIRFTQDGRNFDAAEREIEPPAARIAKGKKGAETAAEVVSEGPAGDDQLAAQLLA